MHEIREVTLILPLESCRVSQEQILPLSNFSRRDHAVDQIISWKYIQVEQAGRYRLGRATKPAVSTLYRTISYLLSCNVLVIFLSTRQCPFPPRLPYPTSTWRRMSIRQFEFICIGSFFLFFSFSFVCSRGSRWGDMNQQSMCQILRVCSYFSSKITSVLLLIF